MVHIAAVAIVMKTLQAIRKLVRIFFLLAVLMFYHLFFIKDLGLGFEYPEFCFPFASHSILRVL